MDKPINNRAVNYIALRR